MPASEVALRGLHDTTDLEANPLDVGVTGEVGGRPLPLCTRKRADTDTKV